jgi:predicted acetyltransferase
MPIEYRRAADEDELDVALRTVEAAFGSEPDEAAFERARKTMPPDRALVALDGARVVGVAASWPYTLTIPGGELGCGGVTWVGVLPTHRRRGVASGLMRSQIEDLHERGEPLAALWASESLIYGRFGYGMSAPVYEMDALKARFAFRDDPGPVGSMRLIGRDEAAELFPPVYERVRAIRTGMTSRSSVWWYEQRLYVGPGPSGTGPRFFAVLEIDGVVEGYAIYRLRSEWDGGIPNGSVLAIEALGTSRAATREVWRFLFGIDLTERVVANTLDPAAGLFLGVEDPRRLRLKLGDGLWLRLIDVDAALRARLWGSGGSVVVEVRDALCPWNAGRYRIGEEAGRTDAEPELVLDTRDLASAFLGGMDVHALAAAGRIEERATGSVARAADLLRTTSPPFCPEVF